MAVRSRSGIPLARRARGLQPPLCTNCCARRGCGGVLLRCVCPAGWAWQWPLKACDNKGMAEEFENEVLIAPRVVPEPEKFKFVRYQQDGEVARVTLDRPEHNLLHEAMLRELALSFE